MTTFFKNKKTILVPVWGFFAQIWVKINFRRKKGSALFNIPIIYYCTKNQKKLMTHSREKYRTWTDRQTDR